MQTPLAELIEWIDDYYELNKCAPSVHNTKKKATELLEKEMTVIQNAFSAGWMDGASPRSMEIYGKSSDYYTKTFTGEND